MPIMNQLRPETGDHNGMPLYGGSADPVFVLCGARSGSTLLRFLLDAHPELACPPETNLPGLCAQLTTVWSLIEGAPLAAGRGDEPPVIPETAIVGVRHVAEMMTGSYLARRGKRRYCDKSLGTARYAELLLRIYPDARLLCLYRHPMDVIASGVEACPWGLDGYGFEPYIASTPGNAVLALASFWADNADAILAVEERFPQACHRVRYEDLVSDPESVAEGIFRFLGVPVSPGISRRCFTADRERSGPADYKIWHTSQITADSVGRGWSVPAGMIAPPLLERIRELTEILRYIPVDENWGTASVPADLRLNGTEREELSLVSPPHDAASELIGTRLAAGMARTDWRFTGRWETCMAESFQLVIIPPVGTHGTLRWRVDLAARSAVSVTEGDDDTAWDVIGSAGAWQRVLHGSVSLSVALRQCELRYCDIGDAGPVAADTRIGMLADLLGLTSWDLAGSGTAAQPRQVALAGRP